MTETFHSLILAAGKGTRMKSELPKVVHPILGKPMVRYVIDAVKEMGSAETIVVTGFKSELVQRNLTDAKVSFVEQTEQLGTGHAVQCYARQAEKKPDHLLVVCGDTPLISRSTLKEMLSMHLEQKPAITMMTLEMESPGNYGRIVRKANKVVAIREAKDCSAEELKIKEVNLAVYLFNSDFLFNNIFKLNSENKQNEFYLTDLIEMAANKNDGVLTCKEKDESSTLGINSRMHLAQVSTILQQQINNKLMDEGVTIVNPDQTTIGPDCRIGRDSIIWPGTIITGNSNISEGCEIGPNCEINSSSIGKNSKIKFSIIEHTSLKSDSKIKPFSVIKPGNS
ncbi:MAG: bifunctional UDP-N-acetylglucosamine diphosphorylase/glucosamine-1-phosphate N-acetyltransferase GlmU [Candidatus Rifleibacteriota bacterium]